MASETGPTIAGIAIIVFDRVPVARMGADPQAGTGTGAVTLETDIAVAVTCPAGLQVASGLTGMIGYPLAVAWQVSTRVTSLALIRRKIRMVGSDTAQGYVTELPPVGEKLGVLRTEFGVALAAVLLVMTAVALLGIVLGLQRMYFEKIAAMAFGNIIGTIILRR